MAAMIFTTLRNTNQETIIKFSGGSADSGTITIADLGCATQVRNSDTPKVNMVRIMASGQVNAASFIINRNSTVFFVGAPAAAIEFDFTSNGFSDSQNNTSNFDFTVNGSTVTGYITLRKIAGWDNKVENEVYGAYDDPTRVGASTTKSGSPDKV